MSYWTAEVAKNWKDTGNLFFLVLTRRRYGINPCQFPSGKKLTLFLSIAEQKGVEEKAERSGKMENRIRRVEFFIKPTAFKHTGLFPEQEPNWQWIINNIKMAKRPVSVLNLFGYTGGATLAALSAGAQVAHVDGSKSAITWAKENAVVSGLAGKPVRWILDDAREFVKREIRREVRYDGIVMDPPVFGHGPKKELWKIEDDFLGLMKICGEVLSKSPVFFLINGYSAGYSSIAYENNLSPLVEKFGGEIEKGELAIEESETGRLLPAGIFARWSCF